MESISAGKESRTSDRWIIASVLGLICLSILMVFSTTAVMSQEQYGSSYIIVGRHFAHVVLGLLACVVCNRLRIDWLHRFSLALVFLSLLLLIIVLIPEIGHVSGGARRWLSLGGFRFQPGEAVKLTLVIYFASYICRHQRKMTHFVPGTLVPCVVLCLFAVLLLLEPDFGSTGIVVLVVLCQLSLVSRLFHLFGVGVIGAALLVALVYTSPYRMQRVASFLHPLETADSSGYQLVQSLIAVGSGGLTGAGLGAGKQKLFYLPAAHTDFIYAVIAEELGLLGALGVLAVFLLIAYRGFRIVRALRDDPYLCSLAMGCTLLLVVPALLNMGVVLGMLPTKGMVLPLVAYGGTAMVVHMSVVGLLIHLSRLEI